MSLNETILKITKQLYPTGRVWKIPIGSNFEKLHIALANSEATAFEDAKSVLNSILPDNDGFTSDDATDWERRLGMISNPDLDLETRKLAIIRKFNHPGTNLYRQSRLYMQAQLQSVGFDAYVFEYDQDVFEQNYLNTFQLGERQMSNLFVSSFIEILANRIDVSEDAGFQFPSNTYSIFFIANEDFTDFAYIAESRKEEFRQLILHIKPVQTLGLLYVSYGIWAQLGNRLNITGVTNLALAGMSATRVAFIDSGNDNLRAYDFDGTNWSLVGSGLAIATVGVPSIAAMTSSRIAFIDQTNADLRTYDFDGSTWSQVGNDLNISGISVSSLAGMSSTRVAFIDTTNADLRAYDFDGTDWAQVGNDLNIPGIGAVSLTALSSTRVAFFDTAHENLQVYDFDGTNWSQVGNDFSIAGVGFTAMSALGSTRVAFTDDTNNILQTYEFDGTDWTHIGKDLSIGILTVPAMATLTSNRIALIDFNNTRLTTYKFQ